VLVEQVVVVIVGRGGVVEARGSDKINFAVNSVIGVVRVVGIVVVGLGGGELEDIECLIVDDEFGLEGCELFANLVFADMIWVWASLGGS
jgi:hypothetical protein